MLKTARLTLRGLTSADSAFMVELLNDPAFIKNIGDRKVRTVEDASNYIAKATHPNGTGLFLVSDQSHALPMGITSLLQRDNLPHPDLGFAFLPQFCEKGYAFEAAEAMVRYAGSTLHHTRLLAIISPHNSPSIKLVEKLGFQDEGMVQMTPEASPIKLFGLTL